VDLPEAALAEGAPAVTGRGKRSTRGPAVATTAIAALALATLASHVGALPDDNEQPITIRTDEAIRDETQGTTVYRGDVEIVQGSLVINADEVTLTQADRPARSDTTSRDPLAGSNVMLIEARGAPARMQQLPEAGGELVRARARVIEYFQSKALIRLRNAVRLRQGRMEMDAARMDYAIDRQVITAWANPATGQRVRTEIPPERLPAGGEN
jgi:lipopolysaccharide export system protein LptA